MGKYKGEKLNAPILHVYMTRNQVINAYGPQSACTSLTDAIETFRADMIEEASYHGYDENALFMPSLHLYTSWIQRAWGCYDEGSMEPEDPGNDG